MANAKESRFSNDAIVQSLGRFIRASRASDAIAADEHLRQLGSATGRLLGERLTETAAWNRHYWIDDLAVFSARAVADAAYELRGAVIWDDGAGRQWVEPFHAELRWSDERSGLSGYVLRFADAAVGLGTQLYSGEALQGAADARVGEWMFQFQSS